MNLKAVPLLGLTLFFSACADPADVEIPNTLDQENSEFTAAFEKLEQDEKELLTRYLMRRELAKSFSETTEPSITLTIGDAIAEQKRIETERAEQERIEKELAERVEKKNQEIIERIRGTVTVALTSVELIPQNVRAGRYSDHMNFVFAVQNKSDREIAGVQGLVTFRNLFGDEILSLRLSMDDGFKANSESRITSYGMELNQFNDSHNRLARTESEKLKFEFTPSKIVYSDGEVLEVE